MPPSNQSDAFYLAGLRLLARSDFEKVSVARLARDAGSSVGAFYYRYSDKEAFLQDMIWRTFRGLEGSLDRRFSGEGRTVAGGIRFSEFIADIADDLRCPEVAGVLRAALKLGSTDGKALRSYEDYRAKVGDWAVALFATEKKGGGSKQRIRDGVQILFALIEDAILVPHSAPARISDRRLSEIISDSVLAYTGVSKSFRASPSAGQKPKNRNFRGEPLVEESAEREHAADSIRKKVATKSARRKIRAL